MTPEELELLRVLLSSRKQALVNFMGSQLELAKTVEALQNHINVVFEIHGELTFELDGVTYHLYRSAHGPALRRQHVT
jgi:hypothetical protein